MYFALYSKIDRQIYEDNFTGGTERGKMGKQLSNGTGSSVEMMDGQDILALVRHRGKFKQKGNRGSEKECGILF